MKCERANKRLELVEFERRRVTTIYHRAVRTYKHYAKRAQRFLSPNG